MVGATGVEPVRCHHRGILSPLRLPIPPRPHILRKLFIISLTYINIITYFLKNVKFFFERRQDFFFFCPLGLTTSLSPRIWWGERGFEPAQHLSDGFTVHLLLLKSFSFILHIYYIIFFYKNQKRFFGGGGGIRTHSQRFQRPPRYRYATPQYLLRENFLFP